MMIKIIIKIIKQFFPFFIITLIALPLLFPFLRKGFFISHDGEWAVIRLAAYNFALKDGQLPPRFAGNLFHSYGYPVLNFNYPLPSMIGEVFHFLGLGFVDSLKGVFILSIILSGIFFYLLLKEIFNKFTALLGTVLYLYYPFRLVDLFIRGSIGESLSFAILPLVYWSLVKLVRRKAKHQIAISGLSIALLILSHNSVALISLPFIILFMVFNLIIERKKRKSLFHCFTVSLLIGLGLSCFFWLPALYEKQWTILKPEIITQPTDHFPSLQQLIFPSWGYGQSKSPDSLSFQLGPIHLIFALFSLGVVLFKKPNRFMLFFLLVLSLNIFFLLPVSSFFWKKLPLMAFISYPWRFLVPIGFYLSVIASFALSQMSNKYLKVLTVFAVFLTLFFITEKYRQPLAYVNKEDMFYITNQSTTIEGDENTPVWVKIPPKEAPKEKIIISGEYKIEKQKSNLLEFSIKTDRQEQVMVNTIYYPGWRLFVNDKEEAIKYDNPGGLIAFDAPAGESQMELLFQETLLRLTTDLISLVSIVILLGFIFLKESSIKLKLINSK